MYTFLFLFLVNLTTCCDVDALHRFFRENGISFSDAVRVGEARVTGGGLGVTATADLTQGQQVLLVPGDAYLSVNKLASAELQSSIAFATLSPTDQAAVALLEARAAARAGTREALPGIAAYFACLPETVSSALLWDKSQLRELQRSPAVRYVQSRMATLQQHFTEEVEDTYFSADLPSVSRDSLVWALSMVWSRSFVVRTPGDEDAPLRAIVPGADFFNGAPVSDIHPSFTEGAASVLYRTTSDIVEGSEVFASYGAAGGKSSVELLLDYGYVENEQGARDGKLDEALTHSPFDRVVIVNELPLADPRKKQLLEEEGIPNEPQLFVQSVRRTFPATLFRLARVAYSTADEVASGAVEAMLGHESGQMVVSMRNELATLRELEAIFRRAYDAYGTTLEQDKELLELAGDTLPRWHLQAILVRGREKSLLREGFEFFAQARAELTDMIDRQREATEAKADL